MADDPHGLKSTGGAMNPSYRAPHPWVKGGSKEGKKPGGDQPGATTTLPAGKPQTSRRSFGVAEGD